MTGRVRGLSVAAVTLLLASGCISGPATARPTSGPIANASFGPTPTVVATPSLAPEPSATSSPAQPNGWRPVPDQDALENLHLYDVAWSGSQFVAVGIDLFNGGTFAIISADGMAWHRVELDAHDAEDLKVAAGPRGIVVLGTIDGAQATWASSTGVTWASRRAAFILPPNDVDGSVNAVLATDDGWLAVGHEFLGCTVPDCGDATIRPIVWTSGDGIDWTRVSDQSALGHGQMVAVARGGPGYVAVGSASAHVAAVWTSTDGKLWSRVQDAAKLQPPADAGRTASVFMSSVAAAGHEVVAVGMMGELQGRRGPVAWWSPDGIDWSLRVKDLALAKLLDPFIAAPGGFLALGPRGEDRCLGGLWSSTTGTPRALLTDGDGSVWSCAATDPMEAAFVPLAGAASGEIVVWSDTGPAWSGCARFRRRSDRTRPGSDRLEDHDARAAAAGHEIDRAGIARRRMRGNGKPFTLHATFGLPCAQVAWIRVASAVATRSVVADVRTDGHDGSVATAHNRAGARLETYWLDVRASRIPHGDAAG